MEQGGDYCFLIDEAHNLVDRAREMFSAELFKKPILDLKNRVKKEIPQLAKVLTKINSTFIKARWLCEDSEKNFHVQKPPYKDLFPPIKKFLKTAETWLARNQPAEFREDLLDLYFRAMDFIRVSECYDERYATYVETAEHDVRVKMFCLDPSHLLQEALKRGKCAIFFSATLTPLDYFSKILGGEETDQTLKIPSPFPRENLCLMVADNIKTTFRARELTYDHIVDVITALVTSKKGNYLVYLPSYKYLKEVSARFHDRNIELKMICQSSGMSDSEKEQFLNHFSAENHETLIGFAVMGGVFGEGIDLVGDRLSGCAIVGVGLPQIGLERDILRDHFNETLNLGFEYAYMYPGMNKVLQAAGRVIRTETDRGAVLLIDERFAYSAYRALFPPEWLPVISVKNPEMIQKTLTAFW
jgi:DNA excision repair protein ERCC-2